MAKEPMAGFVSAGKESLATVSLSKEATAISSYAKEAIVQIAANKESLPNSVLTDEQISAFNSLGRDAIPGVYADGAVTDSLFDGCLTDTISTADYDGGEFWFTWSKEVIALAQSNKESVAQYSHSKENIPSFVSSGKE